MPQFHQFLFVVALLSLSWFAMMAIHELGHVVGAVLTRGHVVRVVLHPLSISRTDVSPNPIPSVVVWLGPILGCLIPLIVRALLPRRLTPARRLAMFFAGFCLLANGAYISIGSFDRVGDCGVMLQSGSPQWILLAFGALTIPSGLYLWHRLGSVRHFLSDPEVVNPRAAWTLLIALMILVVCEFVFSPM